MVIYWLRTKIIKSKFLYREVVKHMGNNLVYKNEFHRRNYSIMQERDMNGTSFKKIGEMFGLKESSVRQIYYDTKRKQIGLYRIAICKATGKPLNELDQYLYWLCDELGSFAYVVAFLEKRYNEILSKFRNGEPGMSDKALKNLAVIDNIPDTIPENADVLPCIFLS